MIVAIDVGIENPSWVAAMVAFSNVVENKVEYCRRYGIDIEPHEWPEPGMPACILSDKGEVDSAYADMLLIRFGIRAEVAAAFRADWKAVVETRFRVLPAKFKPFVPGYIDTDFRQRGARDYRAEAVLNIDEFTAVIIRLVLYYNNHHELKGYDRDRDMVADNVPCIPADLYAWGRINRSGAPRRFHRELVKFCLLPTGEAVVTTRGIHFRGSYFTCPRAEEERWFDRARQKGAWRILVSWDPRLSDLLYAHDEKHADKYDVCTLTDRSRAWRGLSDVEILLAQATAKHGLAERSEDQALAAAELTDQITGIVERAKKRQPPFSPDEDRHRVGRIREGRAIEQVALRKENAFRLGDAVQPTASASEPLPVSLGAGLPWMLERQLSPLRSFHRLRLATL
jgi:hypothetical protein